MLIEGRLVLESWSDSNGQKHSKHTIVAESMQMLGGNSAKADINTSKAVVDNDPNVVYVGFYQSYK